MGLIVTDEKYYINIANALRFKTNSDIDAGGRDYAPSEMAPAILNLPANKLPQYFDKTLVCIETSDLPEGTVVIEEGLFANNTSLLTVDLPLVQEVNAQAFINCTSLHRVNLPSAWWVGLDAFSNTNIEYFKMHIQGCLDVGCFYNSKLTHCEIQGGSDVAGNSFANCTNLSSFAIRGPYMAYAQASALDIFTNTPILQTNPTTGLPMGKIYVNPGLIERYKTATGWCDLPTNVWEDIAVYDSMYNLV